MTKAFSIFVLLFLCLNFGGSLCISICTPMVARAAATKSSCHSTEAEGAKDRTEIFAESGLAIDCCSLPVSFFAAPLKRIDLSIAPFQSTSPIGAFNSFRVRIERDIEIHRYRPPPIDRSRERIKQGVIRI